ncbi:hypothetical protein JK358_18115 [Nocardia sp. 2]|uniref:Uncharacterized protein n=1 Tax=Nocardia acididurans TaxID=2802282 RepID=A0ABS1M6P4_9NOCA|nr:hypothetical protein [Nocardia acididurans]MBL1076317.1 hypothetical protein [Nocardia acididurans]
MTDDSLADAILRMLDRRGIPITEEHRARIRARTNLELLDMWLIATVVDQLADDAHPADRPEPGPTC